MALSQAKLVQPQGLSTVERDLLTLAGADTGRLIYNETTNELQQWDGVAWRDVLVGPTVDATILTGEANGGVY